MGLLDQHSHSGAAQVDLSSDRRTSAGSASVSQLADLRMSRKTAKWSRPAPTEQRGDIPDWFHRIHRRARSRQPAGATRRFAEPAGPRPRSAGSRGPPVARLCSCIWISRASTSISRPACASFAAISLRRTSACPRRLRPPDSHHRFGRSTAPPRSIASRRRAA